MVKDRFAIFGPLLPDEPKSRFSAIVSAMQTWLKPTNDAESYLSELISTSLWRYHRFTLFEARLFELQEKLLPDFVRKMISTADATGRQAYTFTPLEDKFRALAQVQTQTLRQTKDLIRIFSDLRKISKKDTL